MDQVQVFTPAVSTPEPSVWASAIDFRRQLLSKTSRGYPKSPEGTAPGREIPLIGVADVSLRGLGSPKEGEQKTFWSPSSAKLISCDAQCSDSSLVPVNIHIFVTRQKLERNLMFSRSQVQSARAAPTEVFPVSVGTLREY